MSEQQEPTVEQLKETIRGKDAIIGALEQQRNAALNEVAVTRANSQLVQEAFQKKLGEVNEAFNSISAKVVQLEAELAGMIGGKKPVAEAVAATAVDAEPAPAE